MFATLVTQVPSVFEGGILRVMHANSTTQFYSFAVAPESYFYAAAFYADCEHEVSPVTKGHRLCLLYNIVRKGSHTSPLPSLTQLDVSLKRINDAANKWESHASDTVPTKSVHCLEHQYTKAYLAFAKLKGRDNAVVNLLRSADRFELHLALIEKHVSGVPSYTHGRSYRKRFRGYHDDSDHDDDAAEHHSMEEELNRSVRVLRWVSSADVDVKMSHVTISEDEDDAENDDRSPDREDFEDYTGNAGPSIDHCCHTAVLVLWPYNNAIDIACQSSLSEGIRFVARRAASGDHAKSILAFHRLCTIVSTRLSVLSGKLDTLVNLAAKIA